MSVKIEPATSSVLASISQIITNVWPEHTVPVSHIGAIAAQSGHQLLVARLKSEIIGFLSGFHTYSHTGINRFELDLLAVDPRHRGTGIGKKLISACEAVAKLGDAQVIRTVVRTTNEPMRAACVRCRYAQNQLIHQLLIHQNKGASYIHDNNAVEKGTHLIEVHTLTYSGIWIEGVISPHSFKLAIDLRDKLGVDLAGALINRSDRALVEAAAAIGYIPAGDFNYWHKPIV